ncbi:MAG: hypothetical protein R2769_01945 [Saprospiraceae bacterium]
MITKAIRKFDFVVQAILILICLTIILAPYGAMALGAWQLASAVIWLIVDRDKKTLEYLLSTVAYFLILWAGIELYDYFQINDGLFFYGGVIYAIGAPFALAIFYFFITYNKAFLEDREPASFWDI